MKVNTYDEDDIRKTGVAATTDVYRTTPGPGMTDFLDQWAQSDQSRARLAAQEALITRTTEVLWTLLLAQGISKSELAERMGTTKGYVSQALSGSRNMTLRTLSDICFAMGVTPDFTIKQKHAADARKQPMASASEGPSR